MQPRIWATLALAAGLAAGGPVRAADQAGAAALEAELNGFFADLEQTLMVAVEPAAPVTVVPDGDAYLATVAPFLVSGAADRPGAGEDGLAVAGFDVRLWPLDDAPGRMAFASQSFPAVTLTVDGEVVAELTATLVSDEGVWSDAAGLPLSQTTVIENLRLQVGAPGSRDGVGLVFSAARLETSAALTDRGGGAWDMRSKTTGSDVGIYVGGVIGGLGPALEALGPVDPVTGLPALYHYGTIGSDALLADVPLADWGAFLGRWLSLIAERAAGAPVSAEEGRALLASFLDEAPALPDRMRAATTATDITAGEFTIAREAQTFEVTGLAGDALTLRQSDAAEGFAFTPGGSMPQLAVLGLLVPESYWYELVLHDLPLGHAWRELAGTVDAWIDDPDAAAEVFFRSFADRALAIGTAAELDLRLTWPASQFLLDLDLAVSDHAERIVAGTIDGAFENMDAFVALVGTAAGPEAASALVVLEAFGQREEPAGDGPVVTRYLVEIGADGHVIFNGQSYDVVMRMIDEAIRNNGLDDLPDFIPTPD